MSPLTPEFMRHAASLFREQAAGNDSATEADTGGVLMLEMRDNPHASLMRQLERLIDRDPEDALRMAQTALADWGFEGRMEERLKKKISQIIDLVHNDPEKPGISGPFAKSVLHIVSPQTPLAAPVFVPAPAFGR